MAKRLLLMIVFICTGHLTFARDLGQIKKDILLLINEHRQKMGLKALSEKKEIDEVAYTHSYNMANQKISFGHVGFDERMNVISAKISSVNAMAENVLFGDVDGERAVKLWLNSKGHRKNIEGDYNFTGISIVEGKDNNLYFTMIFIRNRQSSK